MRARIHPDRYEKESKYSPTMMTLTRRIMAVDYQVNENAFLAGKSYVVS